MKKIVVLGGGLGGLQTVLHLSKLIKKFDLREKYRLILADKYSHHTFTPLLYEIAATSKQTADYLHLKSLLAYPFTELLADKGAEFIQDEVLDIDFKDRAVQFRKSRLGFDYLVLALGAETNFFNIPGLKEKAMTLKSFDSAIEIRDAIWSEFEKGKEQISILIGGGGSTGVELAGELKEWACELTEERKRTCRLEITVADGAPTILSGFHPKIVKTAEKRLKKLGVRILTNQRLEKIQGQKARLSGGIELDFDILIWTGGVKASAVTEKMPLKNGMAGRIEVTPTLNCFLENKEMAGICAVGDIAYFLNGKDRRPVPQVARAAVIEGRVAARNIIEEIKEKEGIVKKAGRKIYKPLNYPYIIPVGGKFAIARFGPVIFSGFFAWIVKGLVEFNYLLSVFPVAKAVKIWLKGLWVFVKNDRLG